MAGFVHTPAKRWSYISVALAAAQWRVRARQGPFSTEPWRWEQLLKVHCQAAGALGSSRVFLLRSYLWRSSLRVSISVDQAVRLDNKCPLLFPLLSLWCAGGCDLAGCICPAASLMWQGILQAWHGQSTPRRFCSGNEPGGDRAEAQPRPFIKVEVTVTSAVWSGPFVPVKTCSLSFLQFQLFQSGSGY